MKTKLSDEEAARRLMNMDPAEAKVRDRSAVAEVAAAAQARRDAEERVAQAVRDARENGATWVEIAGALDVSHQAAMQRYKR